MPIRNSLNNEAVLVYIPDFEIDNFLSIIKIEQNKLLESDKCLPSLEKYIKNYIRRSVNQFGIEKRIENSYKTMVIFLLYSNLFFINRKT